jgi:cytochrome c5
MRVSYLKQIVKVSLAVLTAVTVLSVQAEPVPPGTDDQIRERLQPFGKLCRAGEDCGTTAAAASSGPRSGEEVYNQFCFACHAAGVSGAPKFGSLADWQPHIDKGMETLMSSTLNGFNAMPPKGTCMDCSEDELSAAVNYMIDNAK